MVDDKKVQDDSGGKDCFVCLAAFFGGDVRVPFGCVLCVVGCVVALWHCGECR